MRTEGKPKVQKMPHLTVLFLKGRSSNNWSDRKINNCNETITTNTSKIHEEIDGYLHTLCSWWSCPATALDLVTKVRTAGRTVRAIILSWKVFDSAEAISALSCCKACAAAGPTACPSCCSAPLTSQNPVCERDKSGCSKRSPLSTHQINSAAQKSVVQLWEMFRWIALILLVLCAVLESTSALYFLLKVDCFDGLSIYSY